MFDDDVTFPRDFFSTIICFSNLTLGQNYDSDLYVVKL